MTKEQEEQKLEVLLKTICDHFDLEDKAVRERQIRTWRRLKLYWMGFQNTWFSEVAHDWRIYDDERRAQDGDAGYYDKPVNIFRAYLESIIAALSVSIPTIKCYPDDADNPLDLSTAKAGDRIAELVSKYNDVQLLWIHALYIYCTEGLIAGYSYPKSDEKYGTTDKKEYEEETVDAYQCVNCQAQLEDDLFTQHEVDEFMPDDDDVELQDLVQHNEIVCPECGMMLDPELQKSPLVVTKFTGITKEPKTRQCIEVYGGLNVKIPNYARKQSEIPYLRYSYETHYTNAIEIFPDLRDKFIDYGPSSGPLDSYEAWGRLSPQYNGEYPRNTVTIQQYWLRPISFNLIPNEEDRNLLFKRFPNGAKVGYVNDDFGKAENESLDDCWTLTCNPLSDYLHHDPLGALLTSLQDITNDIVSLTLQTIEHGIPQTFADSAVINFKAYGETEVRPGTIYPAVPRSGKSIGDGFYEVKTATLSAEVLPFLQQVQEFSQLVSGALPSLFGGGASGSKTASEYAMSRAQALQRLQTPWKMLGVWWKQIFAKVIPSFIKCMADDEKMVQKTRSGDFVNVFIRKSELEGKLGNIELEAAEQLPTTWGQQKETIMNLLATNNEEILAALGSPENLPYIVQAIGLSQFKIAGEDDRQKQYEEIKLLLASEPIPGPPDMITGQPTEIPSVEIDELIDNHQVEADICRDWAISDAGRLAKMENQNGYKNVLLHMKAHMAIVAQAMQQQMMAQAAMGAPPQGAGEANPSKPPKQDNSAPIKDNTDVQTTA